jgi:hypothetical protein
MIGKVFDFYFEITKESQTRAFYAFTLAENQLLTVVWMREYILLRGLRK